MSEPRRPLKGRGWERRPGTPGLAGLFLVVDPGRRVDCECKTTERVVKRPDGYLYTVPIDEAAP